ncbi:alpha/beta fold hydrolase [Arenibaculum sp.]|uniref:alpha/beta fold hydrolase n=1 Tax=Arenibaculum sp. TaxID=2865862 RepID=UPI002E154D88|nr:alpha/beta fold hydrolase [Arenibaculum sp.]
MKGTPPGREPDPGPPRRLGPRPLALHLAASLTPLLSSPAGLALLSSGWPNWSPALRDRAADLAREVAAAAPAALREAVDREMRRRADAVLTGVERYRRHPYRRDLPDPPAAWNEGGSRLLDHASGGGAVTALFVPSLVNRHYVLDLSAERSLMRWLAARGVRPLLLDWGRPGPAERGFGLTDYVAGRLEAAVTAAAGIAGGPVAVVGYCMGGLLAAALAGRRPDLVRGLGLLAVPWDFHAADASAARRAAAMLEPLEPALAAWGEMPVDWLQAMFAAVDPMLAARKFARFAELDPDGAQARAFVALEDWLNDGVPLAAPVARECIAGWYGRNEPGRGCWRVAGRAVEPARLAMPALAVIPGRDRIVPPGSARALAAAVPGAQALEPPLGHIGLVVSGEAERLVWEPLLDWLRSLPPSG